MKKVLFMIALLLLPIKIYAVQYCDNQDRAALMPYINNVNINYIPTINDDDTVVYTIMINNLTADMVLYDENTKKIYKGFSTQNSEFSIKVEEFGTYNFSILSLKCKEQLGNKSITLPHYNKFYKREECNGLENYAQCKRWSNYVATDEEFNEDIKDLRKELEKKKKEEKKDREKEIIEKIKDFFVDYWGVFVIIAIVAVGGIYIVTSKKKNKTR